jgi:hypothetical protein
MDTADDKRASKLRARILHVANQFLDAYQLTLEGKYAEARVIVYDIDRFEISSIRGELLELEFEKWKDTKHE